MSKIIYETRGNVCESCTALYNDFEPEFWKGRESVRERSIAAVSGTPDYAITTDNENNYAPEHFSDQCIVCGKMPFADIVYGNQVFTIYSI